MATKFKNTSIEERDEVYNHYIDLACKDDVRGLLHVTALGRVLLACDTSLKSAFWHGYHHSTVRGANPYGAKTNERAAYDAGVAYRELIGDRFVGYGTYRNWTQDKDIIDEMVDDAKVRPSTYALARHLVDNQPHSGRTSLNYQAAQRLLELERLLVREQND